jgi:hypothetical protein
MTSSTTIFGYAFAAVSLVIAVEIGLMMTSPNFGTLRAVREGIGKPQDILRNRTAWRGQASSGLFGPAWVSSRSTGSTSANGRPELTSRQFASRADWPYPKKN